MTEDRNTIDSRHGTPKTSSPRLYHGTSLLNFLSILGDGAFHHDLSDDGHGLGLSLSWSRSVATYFAAAKEAEVIERYGFGPIPDRGDHGAVLSFDRAGLEQQTSLVRTSWANADHEAEERTTGPIRPAFAAVVAIHVRRPAVAWYARLSTDDSFEDAFTPKIRSALARLAILRRIDHNALAAFARDHAASSAATVITDIEVQTMEPSA